MHQDIIDLAIKYWNENFVGISGVDISKKLNIQHEKVITILEQFKAEAKGTLNENVVLHPLTFTLDTETNNFKMVETKPITTHIFFPAKELLETYFKENILDFIENGEYTNKLHKKHSPLDLIPFDIKVLGKYLSNKEIYTLNDDVTGGVIRLNSDYSIDMPKEEIDKVYFDKIWYGKRKLTNGNIAVTAILKDLSELTKKEQSYWYGFELEDPIFNGNDEDFNRFVSRAYYGSWADSKDPIHGIKTVIESLNKIFPFKIFSESENPYLGYPINNTYKEFADCNSELYKLIGPDNFKLSRIIKIYLNYYQGNVDELTHKESGRSLSSIQVMALILRKIDNDLYETYSFHLEQVKKARIEGDHKITNPNQNKENYIDSFRNNCNAWEGILNRLKTEFEKQNGV